ncbi:MAG: molecular chaperone DnaJ [Pseudomonadota bacterium]|nr:molecular chaperone DnaJ [Pseudomonadota bacterium]
MTKRDYYEVLGVEKGADAAALKKAYRKQAMKFHPDRNPGDTAAEASFKEVNEAYDTLKDPQKRAAYDQYGHAAFENGGAGAGGFGGFGGGAGHDFGDMFEDMFGDMFGGGRGRSRGPQRGGDLRYNLTISLEEAYAGKAVQVTIPTAVSCNTCDGSGAKKGTSVKTCGTCGGRGEVRVQQGFFAMSRTCNTCGGKGQIITDPCDTCHGSGTVRKEKTLNVNIPKGVDNGTRIRVTGEGEAGENGAPNGDLYIFVQLKNHNLFEREGPHILLDMPIDFVSAALGGQLEVPTLDGKKALLKIPEGAQSGTQFRMRGKGMPVTNSSAYGDMFVNVTVEVPTKLSKKQKELLKQFKNASSDRNSPEQDSFLKKATKFWGLAS